MSDPERSAKKMKLSRLSAIGLASGILVPLIGGALGCRYRLDGLSLENIGWIIYWSAPVVVLNLICIGIVALSFRLDAQNPKRRMTGFIISNCLWFFVAFWFLKEASGV